MTHITPVLPLYLHSQSCQHPTFFLLSIIGLPPADLFHPPLSSIASQTYTLRSFCIIILVKRGRGCVCVCVCVEVKCCLYHLIYLKKKILSLKWRIKFPQC
ncbi:unnamed protein product [Lepidochelys kempii]